MSLPPVQPSVGRIVFFCSDDSAEPAPAVVLKVWNPTCVNLEVFGPNHPDKYPTSVLHSETPTGGPRWFWPPRV